jgi:DNA repair exonuclease SbcCD ATPase subunit
LVLQPNFSDQFHTLRREELSSTSKEKDALTEQRDELLHRVTELANQLEKASEEIKKISSELREDKAALKETKELLDAKMVHLDNSKARAVQLDKALAVAVKEIEVTRGDLDKAVQEAEGLTGSLKASQATLASEKAVNNQLSDEVRVLSERMLQFQNELTAEREFNEKLQRDMESAHKEITRLNGDAKRLTKEIKDHPVEVATMKAAIQDAGSRADKFKREAESERRLCGAARKETEAEREAKEATALKLKEAEDEADKFRRDFEGERAAKELAEMDLSSVRVELDAEKEANKRMNELMVELLEMRDMFPKMESDRDKAIADADSTKASLMKLKDDTMKMIKSVEDKAKEELDAAVVSLENMTNSERAARQSIRNLTTALEDAKNQIVKEDEKLAQSLKREQETSGRT